MLLQIMSHSNYQKIQQLSEGAFKTITAKRWRSVCEHVIKIETDYWTRDNLCESEIEKFVINLEEDSSSEEDGPFLSCHLLK